MSRDVRGTPGRIVGRGHQPKLRLADLLRRRRTTLEAFVTELGVTTHAGLAIWCDRIGVLPPSHEEFVATFPLAEKVNSPQEGVVVLEPPPVIDAETGSPIDPEAPVTAPGIEVVINARSADGQLTEPTDATQKKARRKKDGQPNGS